jgi:hypothetical protein
MAGFLRKAAARRNQGVDTEMNMKFALMLGAAAIVSLSAMSAASAETEFGRPDFPNYMSRIGAVSCDWQYENYFRGCVPPQEIVVPASDAKGPKKVVKP